VDKNTEHHRIAALRAFNTKMRIERGWAPRTYISFEPMLTPMPDVKLGYQSYPDVRRERPHKMPHGVFCNKGAERNGLQGSEYLKGCDLEWTYLFAANAARSWYRMQVLKSHLMELKSFSLIFCVSFSVQNAVNHV
jgi:hypothetical protein